MTDEDECPPPWVALPDWQADDVPNQGAPEAFIVMTWLPYWRSLSSDQRAAYLDRWHAPNDWRAVIAERYDRIWSDAEIAQDAREAEEWAARHPIVEARRWWQFWR